MKIVLVIDDRISRPGGIQEYVLGLYDYLNSHGHEPLILTSGHYSPKAKTGRKIIGVGQPFEIIAGDAQKSIPLIFGDKKKIKKILQQERPQIIHIQGFPGPLSTTVLSHSKATNFMTYHVFSESPINELFGKTLSGFWKKTNQQLDGRIAISRVAAADAKIYFPGNYTIIPIGVDLNRFKPSVSPITRFKDGKINLLFLGRLDKRKGLDYLLKAYKYLLPLHPGIRLIIVGDGPQKKSAQNFVHRNKLKEVVFVGAVSRSELPAYYASADIYCSPATHGESFGVVLLEAMASGLPVVAFDNPGYRGLFPGHAQSFLVFNRSSLALAQALRILIANKELRLSLGKQNRIFAKQFSWGKIGKRILDYYESKL
jgi:phosphatidylinositol alpha-mannosyltransferase